MAPGKALQRNSRPPRARQKKKKHDRERESERKETDDCHNHNDNEFWFYFTADQPTTTTGLTFPLRLLGWGCCESTSVCTFGFYFIFPLALFGRFGVLFSPGFGWEGFPLCCVAFFSSSLPQHPMHKQTFTASQ